jgi:hypothetical protein
MDAMITSFMKAKRNAKRARQNIMREVRSSSPSLPPSPDSFTSPPDVIDITEPPHDDPFFAAHKPLYMLPASKSAPRIQVQLPHLHFPVQMFEAPTDLLGAEAIALRRRGSSFSGVLPGRSTGHPADGFSNAPNSTANLLSVVSPESEAAPGGEHAPSPMLKRMESLNATQEVSSPVTGSQCYRANPS